MQTCEEKFDELLDDLMRAVAYFEGTPTDNAKKDKDTAEMMLREYFLNIVYISDSHSLRAAEKDAEICWLKSLNSRDFATIVELRNKLKAADDRAAALETAKQNLESELIGKTIDLEEAQECVEDMETKSAAPGGLKWHDANDVPDTIDDVVVLLDGGIVKTAWWNWYKKSWKEVDRDGDGGYPLVDGTVIGWMTVNEYIEQNVKILNEANHE